MATINYDSQFYNKEISFCKVYSLESKEKLEKLLLKHRISYYVEWQQKSWLKKLFSGGENRGKNVYIVKINEADAEKARELVQGIDSVKIRREEGKEK